MSRINENRPTINLGGRIYNFDRPKVMGILNVTPDSFYAASRKINEHDICLRIREMQAEGVDIFDVGAYSTRPGADEVSPEEEVRRLDMALEILRTELPNAIVSVDTFRASVARHCVEKWGVQIINDISGGDMDPEIWHTVAELKCAYILMHTRGTPATMQELTDYGPDDDVTTEVVRVLGHKIAQLRALGVADVIVDPGFGFAKTVEQNYRLLRELRELRALVCPVLAALSRKSMIYKYLGTTPEESRDGTIVLDTVALLNGADIIRVHDVRPAVETIRLLEALG